MSTSEPDTFRRRQAIADLRHQAFILPAATIRRIGAGMDLRTPRASNLQKRIEWYFRGKAPLTNLRRDPAVLGAILMASALPDDDFEPFLAATALLVLERLATENGPDDAFWDWTRLAPHYRLAEPPVRAAIMCGFRESRRLGRIAFPGEPEPDDCLTKSRDEVIAGLTSLGTRHPLLESVAQAVSAEADGPEAGKLWAQFSRDVTSLPDEARHAVEGAFRYLYERPASLYMPPDADAPIIPVCE